MCTVDWPAWSSGGLSLKNIHDFTDSCAGQYRAPIVLVMFHALWPTLVMWCKEITLQPAMPRVNRMLLVRIEAKGNDCSPEKISHPTKCPGDVCLLHQRIFKAIPPLFPIRQKSLDLNQRIVFYIPSTGEHSIISNRTDSRFSRFREVKGVRRAT